MALENFGIVKYQPPKYMTIITGLNPKGAYNGAIAYNVGDFVSYGTSSYVMFLSGPAGTVPTNATYWQLVAQGV